MMPDEPYKSYIICTSPRSGSTLLCKQLAATEICGIPDSHFHVPSLQGWLETYALRLTDFESTQGALDGVIQKARHRGLSNNGIFGLRMQHGSFEFFLQQLRNLYPFLKTDTDRIEQCFGKTLIIHLTRENKLDQAISYVKASQTGLWHKAADGTELERLSEPREPFYDAKEIAFYLAEFTKMDQSWLNWFEQEKVEPLHISYTALSHRPVATIESVLGMFGLNISAAKNVELPTARLADEINREWSTRFLAETKDG